MKKKETKQPMPKIDPITGKTLIIVAIILSVGAILFSVIQDRLRTNKIKEDRAYEEQKNKERENKLESCLAREGLAWVNNISAECYERFNTPDCNLPIEVINKYDKWRKDKEDDCFRRYGK